MDARDEGTALADLVCRLRTKFPGAGADLIDAMVTDLHQGFDGKPIRDFVPVLVEREAVDRLAGRVSAS